MTVAERLHIDDPRWLAGVREDLDSDPNAWLRRTPAESMNKLQALGEYLDVILTELGHTGRRHACPDCGVEHMAPKE